MRRNHGRTSALVVFLGAVACGGSDNSSVPSESEGGADSSMTSEGGGGADSGGGADGGGKDSTAGDSESGDSSKNDGASAASDAADSTAPDSTTADANTVDASCPSTGACTVGVLEDGGCVQAPVTDGTACDDGNACDGADSCLKGVCTAGHPASTHDDFNSGTTVDSSKWSTVTSIPQGSASVTQSGGNVTLQNGAYLVSAKPFDPTKGALRVTAEWAFTSTNTDLIQILTRSDATPSGGQTDSGVECSLTNGGQLSLSQRAGGSNSGQVLSATSLTIPASEGVILDMFDSGTAVHCTARREATGDRISVDGTFTGTFTGNYVVFHDSAYAGWTNTGTLDNVTIEPGVSQRPFAQWTFDEAPASSALDWASTYDGTMGSSAQRTASRTSYGSDANVVGNANSYVDFGTSLAALGTSDFTMSFWLDATPAGADILGNRDSSSGGQYLGIRMGATGTLTAEMYGATAATQGGVLIEPTSVGDGNWHYVVLERSGATLTWFVDGAQTATTAVTGIPNITSTKDFLFGKSPFTDGFTNYATGSIDDLRLYNYALASCELRNVFGTP